jgi:hypothetical protein
VGEHTRGQPKERPLPGPGQRPFCVRWIVPAPDRQPMAGRAARRPLVAAASRPCFHRTGIRPQHRQNGPNRDVHHRGRPNSHRPHKALPLADYPDWQRAVNVLDAAGIDYLIGEVDLTGKGLGSRTIRYFTAAALERYPELEAVVAAPQQENVASWKALENAGYERFWGGQLDSDDPADAGTSASSTFGGGSGVARASRAL